MTYSIANVHEIHVYVPVEQAPLNEGTASQRMHQLPLGSSNYKNQENTQKSAQRRDVSCTYSHHIYTTRTQESIRTCGAGKGTAAGPRLDGMFYNDLFYNDAERHMDKLTQRPTTRKITPYSVIFIRHESGPDLTPHIRKER